MYNKDKIRVLSQILTLIELLPDLDGSPIEIVDRAKQIINR